MVRHIILVSVCLGLACGGVACAPPRLGPVPVTFELEPGWARSAALAPSTTRTRGGLARALFSEPRTTGVVRMMVRVDGTTAQVHLTVLSYQEPSDSPDVP